MFKARVPSGSVSHLSGNRFAAPNHGVSQYFGKSCKVVIDVRLVHVQCTTTCGLYCRFGQRAGASGWNRRKPWKACGKF